MGSEEMGAGRFGIVKNLENVVRYPHLLYGTRDGLGGYTMHTAALRFYRRLVCNFPSERSKTLHKILLKASQPSLCLVEP
jgi:hypothetical protein